MTVVNVEFRANGNFNDLVAQVSRVNKSIAGLNASLNAVNSEKINGAFREFSNMMTRSGQFTSQMVHVTGATEKFGTALSQNKLSLRENYKAMQQYVTGREGQIRKLARQQVMMERSMVIARGRTANGQLAAQVMTPTGLGSDAATKMRVATKEAQIFNRVMAQGSTGLVNWGKNTQWAGRQLTVGLTVPMTIFAGAAGKAFYEADQGLTRMAKVYGSSLNTMGSNPNMAKIRGQVMDLAKELASSWGQDINETIGLAGDIAAVGKEGQDLLDTTRESTRLAVLGEVDRQTAMKTTLALQTAFKQNTTELSQSIDFLNAVENQTSLSLEDLTTAIPKAGPVVRALGGDVKDLALLMTSMKEGGIPAAEGANALKSGLASIINPAEKTVGMFKELGINITKIVNSNKGHLIPTIMDLKSALDGLDPLERARAIEQMFGKFQFARISAMFNNLGASGSQTLQVMKLMKASTAELGAVSANEMAQMTESASGRFKRAWATVQADLAIAGEKFLNMGTVALGVLTKIFDFFQKMPSGLKTFLTIAGVLTAAVGPLIMFAGIIGNFLGYMVKGIALFRTFGRGGASAYSHLTAEAQAANVAGDMLESNLYNQATATEVMETAVMQLTKALQGMATASVEAGAKMEASMAQAKLATERQVLTDNRAAAHIIPSADYGVAGKMSKNALATTTYISSGQNTATSVAQPGSKFSATPERLFDPALQSSAALTGMMDKQAVVLQKDLAHRQARLIVIEQQIQAGNLSAGLFTDASTKLSVQDQQTANAAKDAQIKAAMNTAEFQADAQKIEVMLNDIYATIVAETTDAELIAERYVQQVRLLTEKTMGLTALQGTISTGTRNSGPQTRMRTATAVMTTGSRDAVVNSGITTSQAAALSASTSGASGPSMPIDAGPAAAQLTGAGAVAAGTLAAGGAQTGQEIVEGSAEASNNLKTGASAASKFARGVGSFGMTAGMLAMMSGRGGAVQKFGEIATMLAISSPVLEKLAGSSGFVKLGAALKGIGTGAGGAAGKVGLLGKTMGGLRGVGGMVARLAPLAFGPWGLAIGGTVLALAYLRKRHNDEMEKIRSQTHLTAASAEQLGIKVSTLSATFDTGKASVSDYTAEIQKLAAEIDAMDDKESTKVFTNALKDAGSLEEAKGLAHNFFTMSLAAGAKPKDIRKIINAALVSAGKEKYVMDIGVQVDNESTDRIDALTEQFRNQANAAREAAAAVAEANKNAPARGGTIYNKDITEARQNNQIVTQAQVDNMTALASEAGVLEAKDFSKLRDQLVEAGNAGGMVGTNWENARDALSKTEGLTGMAAENADSWGDYLNRIYLLQNSITPSINASNNALMVGSAILQQQGDIRKEQQGRGLLSDTRKRYNIPDGSPSKKESSAASAPFVDPYKKQKDAIDDRIAAEDKLIEKIREKQQAEKDALDEKKRQLEFEKSMYEKMIGYREAIASGDLGQAAIIKNDMQISQKEHDAEDKQKKKDDKYDKQVKAAEKRKQALEDQKAAYEDMTQAAQDAHSAEQKATSSAIKNTGRIEKAADAAVKSVWDNVKGRIIQSKSDLKKYIDEDTRSALRAAGVSMSDFLTDTWSRYQALFGKAVDDMKKLTPGMADLANSVTSNVHTLKQIAKAASDGTPIGTAIADALKVEVRKNLPDNVSAITLKNVDRMITEDVDKLVADTNSTVIATSGNVAAGKMSQGKYDQIMRYIMSHEGGLVGSKTGRSGERGLRSDEVNRTLQVGEFVIQKSSVDKFGHKFFEDLNNGKYNAISAKLDVGHAGDTTAKSEIEYNDYKYNITIMAKDGASAREVWEYGMKQAEIMEKRKGKARK